MKFPEQYRMRGSAIEDPWATTTGDPYGLFVLPPSALLPDGLKILVTDGKLSEDGHEDTGWEHVSVSHLRSTNREPSWQEMCIVKGLFWSDDECVVQFHPPRADYVNVHPHVLHLWRWREGEFPMPPKMCV